MKNLRAYQKEAVEKIYEFFYSDKIKATMQISTGIGKIDILVAVIEKIFEDNRDTSIAVLTTRRPLCEQIEARIRQSIMDIEIASSMRELLGHKILVTTYYDADQNEMDAGAFDFIILDRAEYVNEKNFCFLLESGRTKYLGILDSSDLTKGWLSNAECLFIYTTKDAIRDGYGIQGSERNILEQFLIRLLDVRGYRNISQDVELGRTSDYNMRADLFAEKDNEYMVIEVKYYRNLHNSKAIVDNALKRILMYQRLLSQKVENKKSSFVLVMPCEIEDQVQKEILEQHNIVIWDINNLIYMCRDNKELLNLLMRCIPFSSHSLEEKKPLDESEETSQVVIEETQPSMIEKFQKMLDKCNPGREDQADKQYENVCTEIIKYLFETEFYKVSEQYRTGDEMFRMDLLCSLKGTTEFWQFLINFYRTKFVVFEYKNYSDYISQNLVYTTEKYLFPVALRNVAFIISRKGFAPNAEKAAIGCLRENGKLIVSLNDEDLVTMIAMKENGEEPSDFLLDRVEQFLMSVSK